MRSQMRNLWRYITDGATRTNAALEAENAEIRAQLAKRVMDETAVTNILIRNGVSIALEGGACRLMAEMFADQFLGSGAVNYLELKLESRSKMPGEQFVVTMQRCAGETPHQLRAKAEQELAELRKAAHAS
jgi:hypothetical protein